MASLKALRAAFQKSQRDISNSFQHNQCQANIQQLKMPTTLAQKKVPIQESQVYTELENSEALPKVHHQLRHQNYPKGSQIRHSCTSF